MISLPFPRLFLVEDRPSTDCYSSPQIAEAAVVGARSETWGQKVVAIVVLAEPETRDFSVHDMRRALKDRLALYKIPVEMKVVDAIPRNAMGKG